MINFAVKIDSKRGQVFKKIRLQNKAVTAVLHFIPQLNTVSSLVRHLPFCVRVDVLLPVSFLQQY